MRDPVTASTMGSGMQALQRALDELAMRTRTGWPGAANRLECRRVPDLAELLRAVANGEPGAADRLLPLVYDELRAIAARQIARERPGITLQATALVHEAFLRLFGDDAGEPQHWQGIGHFHAAAAESIRRILVDAARNRGAQKRGGGWQRVTLSGQAAPIEMDRNELLDLDQALCDFAVLHARQAKLVELRYFGGLSLAECAAALSIAPATADRDWAYARAWLHDRLRPRP